MFFKCQEENTLGKAGRLQACPAVPSNRERGGRWPITYEQEHKSITSYQAQNLMGIAGKHTGSRGRDYVISKIEKHCTKNEQVRDRVSMGKQT